MSEKSLVVVGVSWIIFTSSSRLVLSHVPTRWTISWKNAMIKSVKITLNSQKKTLQTLDGDKNEKNQYLTDTSPTEGFTLKSFIRIPLEKSGKTTEGRKTKSYFQFNYVLIFSSLTSEKYDSMNSSTHISSSASFYFYMSVFLCSRLFAC